MLRLTKTQWILFVFIIIISSFLRLYKVTEQGLIYWDEGMYMNEAKFYSSIAHNIPFVMKQLASGIDIAAVKGKLDGWPPSASKPLHGFIIFLFSIVIGLHDYTGQMVSAVFSIMTLILFFGIIKNCNSVQTAFITVFILAVSPYQIMFSRSAFPEMDSIFFFMLTVLCYLNTLNKQRQSNIQLILCGVFFGLSLTTNFRWFMLIPSFILFELIINKEQIKGSIGYIPKRLLLILAGMVLLVVIIDIPYIVASMTLEIPSRFAGYHEQFFYYLKKLVFMSGDGAGGMFTLRSHYIRLYFYFTGHMQSLFLLAGTIFLIKRKKEPLAIISLTVFYSILLGLSCVKRGDFARYNSVIYPFGAYITACGIAWIVNSIPLFRQRKIVMLTFILAAITGLGLLQSQKFIFMRSGYRDAMQYLSAHKGGKHLSPTNSISEFYFGRNVPDHLPRSLKEFIVKMESGEYEYLLVDYAQHFLRDIEINSVYKYLRENKKPVLVISNPMGEHLEVVLENLHYLAEPGGEYEYLMNDPQTKEIRIYSTEGLLPEIKQLNASMK